MNTDPNRIHTVAFLGFGIQARTGLLPSFVAQRDLGINVMTLGGLAVGIGDIVDASIIFVEIIWRSESTSFV